MKSSLQNNQASILENNAVITNQDKITAKESFDESLLHILNNLHKDEEQSATLSELEYNILAPLVLLAKTNLNLFKENVNELMQKGVNIGTSTKGKLYEAYKLLANNELELAKNATPEEISLWQLGQLMNYTMRPETVETMSYAIKALLTPNHIELNFDALREAVNHARTANTLSREYFQLTNDEIISQVTNDKLVVVQLHYYNGKGEIESAPTTLVLNKEEIVNRSENLGFITKFSATKITQEYFPAKNELAECLVLAFRNSDLGFIKLCLDNNKLTKGILEAYPDLFHEMFEKGRADFLDIMVEYELFGFTKNDFVNVDVRLPFTGRTALMEACINGDATLVRTLIAMGADITLTDNNGYNALMYAIQYSEEQAKELNKPSEEQSEEFKNLKSRKNQIVNVLLKDKKIDLNAKNFEGKTAMQIALEQGITKNAQGITELRGDHGAIEQMIAAGADPTFGRFEWSYKAKFLMTLGLSIGLTTLKDAILNYIGIGFIGRTVFYPVIRLIDYAIDGIVAYKAYLDVKNPLYVFSRTFLDSEYANDTLINMDKKPMIGAFHTNWYGKIITGEDLKNYMANHVGYRNIKGAFFTAQDIPVTGENSLKLSRKAQLELGQTLFNRLYRIEQSLNTHWMAPWTRKALEKLAQDIKEAYTKLNVGYKVNSDHLELLRIIFTPANQQKLLAEIYNSPEKRELFYKFNSLVKMGALSIDLEIRHNLEKFEQLLNSPQISKSITNKNDISNPDISFANFEKFCKGLTIEGIDLDTTFRIVEHEFYKGLKNELEPKTLLELLQDTSSNILHGVIDTGVTGISYATGCSRGTVHHYLAEGLSTAGALGNSALHVGLREFYDSIYFIPTTIAAAAAYVVYKWPSQSWEVFKSGFNAVCTLATFTFKAFCTVAPFAFNVTCAVTACTSKAISTIAPFAFDAAYALAAFTYNTTCIVLGAIRDSIYATIEMGRVISEFASYYFLTSKHSIQTELAEHEESITRLTSKDFIQKIINSEVREINMGVAVQAA